VYRAEETVSGRRTATLPLPVAASGFSVAIAEKLRSSWLSEIDTAGAELELLVALDDDVLGVLLLLLLLQAAAARHKATDTDATAAPFLATRIIKTTSCLKGKGRIQACDVSSQAWRTSRP
jgi:hypothetical protein